MTPKYRDLINNLQLTAIKYGLNVATHEELNRAYGALSTEISALIRVNADLFVENLELKESSDG